MQNELSSKLKKKFHAVVSVVIDYANYGFTINTEGNFRSQQHFNSMPFVYKLNSAMYIHRSSHIFLMW